MDRGNFLFEDKLKQIKASFIKNGWITISDTNSELDNSSELIYCCIIEQRILEEYKSNSDWLVEPGSEGKPSIITYFKDNQEVTEYHSLSDDGAEPFIFSKHFNYSRFTNGVVVGKYNS